MSVSRLYHNDLIHLSAQTASQSPVSMGYEGFVVPGSFDPKDGTVHVTIGNTYAIDQNEFDSPLTLPNIRIATGHVGMMGGPIGGERVALHPIEGGFIATLYHDEDDVPGLKAGEWCAMLRQDPAVLGNQPQPTFIKLQNDGVARIGGQNNIALISPQVTLGFDGNPQNTLGVVRQSDLQDVADKIIKAVQTAFNNFAKTVQPGSGVPAPTLDKQTAGSSSSVFATD